MKTSKVFSPDAKNLTMFESPDRGSPDFGAGSVYRRWIVHGATRNSPSSGLSTCSQPTLYYSAILRPIGITAYCLPKLSVVILLIGLMGPVRRGVWFLWLVIAILFITSALSFILLFAQCNPPDHLWHPFDEAECFPDYILDAVTYVAGCE